MTDLVAFELYLMTHMRGQASIDAALAALGLSNDSMDEAKERVAPSVGFFEMKARSLEAYAHILGAPSESVVDEAFADSKTFTGSRRHRFHLLAWPELDFVLRTHPAGWVFGPEFVRRIGGVVPSPSSVRDLRPWTIVESEVVERFGGFASEDAWNSGKDATYVFDDEGIRREITLVFDFALLQRVEIVAR
jgi:hypothetical protein